MQIKNHASHLKEYFGFDTFRDRQEEIVDSILSKQDTLVIMPTGGGKSLCYQLPALISEGTAIIVSPLIALMKNQVDQLRTLQEHDEVAHVLNSTLTVKQAREVKQNIVDGVCKIVYIAPETLIKEETIEFFKTVTVSFIGIDEAHCISEWGHDFRPDYRKIRPTITAIGEDIPVIALTATATPKVREDIVRTMQMENPKIFISSFLRDNLYYEVRHKGNNESITKQMVQYIKAREGQSGVVYCLSRKSTQEVANVLCANGINAAAYHAGLDSNTRSKVQDAFLMDDVDVICATIAFGMGIDKPDVRFVIHHDIPKSIENYYQETGRAGRDGVESSCLAFFSHKDINKLEKFLKDKPVAEKEVSSQHLAEMSAFSESASCRRKFLLHYFGESYQVPQEGCKHCDNCNYPKETIDVKADAIHALQAVKQLKGNHPLPYVVDFISGRITQQLKSYSHQELSTFGIGKEKDKFFWNSLLRNLMLDDFIVKDIEKYGLLKITEKGEEFLNSPKPMKIALFHDFLTEEAVEEEARAVALDEELYKLLLQLRKKVAKQHGLQPTVIFLENSLNDMATQYPISDDDMAKIVGVSLNKAKRYGKPFIELIKQYVEDNDIDRPTDFVVKQANSSSKYKVKIIQQIDQKLSFEEIEHNLGIDRAELMAELETIVGSGTKLSIDYYVEDNIDEDVIEDIMEYFLEAETLSLDDAAKELEPEGYSYEEIELIRIKFYSDHAN